MLNSLNLVMLNILIFIVQEHLKIPFDFSQWIIEINSKTDDDFSTTLFNKIRKGVSLSSPYFRKIVDWIF